ncbi:hypothetical protein CDAR_471371 [Caerostris darwini]|uniref:Uncharacterized protein n=1 Tax=Caerostris darwini TaxID=1538125 RepID=A0AAV4RMU0_9ARAC|nr:hypothetical protein CDAR_471371 [Caerostris darwini]
MSKINGALSNHKYKQNGFQCPEKIHGYHRPASITQYPCTWSSGFAHHPSQYLSCQSRMSHDALRCVPKDKNCSGTQTTDRLLISKTDDVRYN